jgi:predicted dehydrogenase
MPAQPAPLHRRDIIKASVAATASLAAGRVAHAEPASPELIRVGLVGAGGRGTGALQQALSVPGSNVQVTAIADAFGDRIRSALNAVGRFEGRVAVPEERRFVGLDGFRQVLDHCDLVILAAPPAFRPFHFEAAIRAGRHVFMEKPVCIDAFGARLCLDAARMADEKKLKVVVGLQRRYQDSYRQALARVREGAIGEIVAGSVFWNSQRPWWKPRKPEMTELAYQIYNWGHFLWLSGDHIVEQHVHNIDVANWFLGKLPETAYGVGGLQVRNPAQPTQIYDHHAVTFTYPGGVRISSMCRQFPGGENRVEEEFIGTKGILKTRGEFAEITDHAGKPIWKHEEKVPNPYQMEHDVLHDAIRNGKPLNDAWHGTTSSFSAVLGRYATYSGRQVRYDDVLAYADRTMPETLAWDSPAPVKPLADGSYPIPMPATFRMPRAATEPA